MRSAIFVNSEIAGLLIKNQLVTHLTLGIALRAVLDALRKPADSKVSIEHLIMMLIYVNTFVLINDEICFYADVCIWYNGSRQVYGSPN